MSLLPSSHRLAMKFHAVVFALASVAVAAPAGGDVTSIAERQSPNAVTDQLLFSLTLPQFTARRNKRDPATLDWSSDGCTSSPDNPFGFPYLPACHRHDFGYQNYRKQSRFTKDAKARIDSNFKKDLYYQCQGVGAKGACEALADVYYEAVRKFGGGDASKREDSDGAYEEAVARYEAAVKDAQEQGLLPVLD
ncbi:phospholipase A2 [Purpureocillium lavendulum]|uniref:Phospholipase A2 n=1 Tax=Purpureocillium lavendulum TaxID=1247861 RepID=A0AB34G1K1_9HYPO|nr:phospholipase A2 [Purpureocillium lavendulum]